jgi:hypothetical protein
MQIAFSINHPLTQSLSRTAQLTKLQVINHLKYKTKSFIHTLNHMSTQNCHSKYDSAGYLTPIIQSSKKQKPYCSCKRLLYQPPLRKFFSLTFVLIFNFIHPYPSGNTL